MTGRRTGAEIRLERARKRYLFWRRVLERATVLMLLPLVPLFLGHLGIHIQNMEPAKLGAPVLLMAIGWIVLFVFVTVRLNRLERIVMETERALRQPADDRPQG